MYLNAEIIFDSLKEHVPVEMHGTRSSELTLDRPTFVLGDEKAFAAGWLFFTLADRLPLRPEIQEGVVIICIGESQRLSYYKERCCVIQIKERADFFHVANLVQKIFDRYTAWDGKLQEILSHTASVQEMIEYSYAIFENPLFVIDADFHVIANTGYDGTDVPYTTDSSVEDNVSLPTLAQFLELHEPSMHVREPLLLNLLDSSTLNTNVFIHDEYRGCVTIDYRLRRHKQSDIALAKHLAKAISQAIEKLSSTTSSVARGVLKHALQDLVEGLPISLEQQRTLESFRGTRFICARMQLASRLAKLPAGYICNELECSFPGSIAFVHESGVVGFIELDQAIAPEETSEETLKEKLVAFIHSMDIRVGVSDTFTDLIDARLYCMQATRVLECGELLRLQERYFSFQDLALTEMVLNATGELPYKMYFSQGLRRLAHHDATAEVSYLDTLRTYLENNMSVSKTAAALYIHRSTLLERLARIKRELESELQDPDERLRIQLVLKAQQVDAQLHGTTPPKSKETPAEQASL